MAIKGQHIEYILGDINKNITVELDQNVVKLYFIVGVARKTTLYQFDDSQAPIPTFKTFWGIPSRDEMKIAQAYIIPYGGSPTDSVELTPITRGDEVLAYCGAVGIPSSIVSPTGILGVLCVELFSPTFELLCRANYSMSFLPSEYKQIMNLLKISAGEDTNVVVDNIEYNTQNKLVRAYITIYEDPSQTRIVGRYTVYAEYDARGRLYRYKVQPIS